MTRQAFAGTILLVEGGPRQQVLARAHRRERVPDRHLWREAAARGRNAAFSNARRTPGVWAYLIQTWRHRGTSTTVPNILAPDAHDLETMLFLLASLDRILAEHADPTLLASLVAQSGSPIS